MNQYKEDAKKWIEENEKNISDWHQIIWEYAEPVWREYKSAAWYVNFLRENGFTVEEGSGDMPTAFAAYWRNGEGGPTIGTYAEYDAVPEQSQQQVPYKSPRENLNPYAAGHTDPHSALGIGALAGVLAAKSAMEKHNISGCIQFMGEPAEKVCGSKPIHAARGYYDKADAFISFHPAYRIDHCNSVNWDIQCGASYGKVFTFECKNPETWGECTDRVLMPIQVQTARAPGAVDAVCLMYTTSRYTYASMLPRNSGWYISESIMVGGQATADHMAPRLSQIYYCWRSPTIEMQERINEVLESNAKHVAAITHCEYTSTWVQKNRPGITNHVMCDLTYKNLELAGAPQFGEEAKAFGREIVKNLGYRPKEDPFMPECSTLHHPLEVDKLYKKNLPPWQKNTMSDDYTEYTWHAPTSRLLVGRCMIDRVDESQKHVYPMWAWNALGGKRECIDPTIFTAGKTIAYTILDLMTSKEILAKAKAEFNERTGGGIGGTKWLPPLMDKNQKPPFDFRWPEYITTERAENDWGIPYNPE